MSSYACEPDVGSEQEVGWKWALVMSESCDVTVVTRENNRERIETWLRIHPGHRSLSFHYLDGGPLSLWIKKKMPGGVYIYYLYWQLLIRFWLRGLDTHKNWDLIHHVTFASFRMPVGATGPRMIWGPVGGADMANTRLLKGHGSCRGRLREQLRNFFTRVSGSILHLTSPIQNGKCSSIALASTPATRDLLVKSGIPASLMPTIGIDVTARATSHDEAYQGRLRLLYVGRMHLLKGIHLLLEAASNIDKEDYDLTLIGAGPEKSRLQNFSKVLGIDDHVRFLDKVPRHELDTIYAKHDVLIAPSLYESGGMAVLEAFSHGMPAIVLDCGGPALAVTSDCGIKIPPDMGPKETIIAIRHAIQKYIQDRSLLKSHGDHALHRAKTHYDWHAKAELMSSIYEELINNP